MFAACASVLVVAGTLSGCAKGFDAQAAAASASAAGRDDFQIAADALGVSRDLLLATSANKKPKDMAGFADETGAAQWMAGCKAQPAPRECIIRVFPNLNPPKLWKTFKETAKQEGWALRGWACSRMPEGPTPDYPPKSTCTMTHGETWVALAWVFDKPAASIHIPSFLIPELKLPEPGPSEGTTMRLPGWDGFSDSKDGGVFQVP